MTHQADANAQNEPDEDSDHDDLERHQVNRLTYFTARAALAGHTLQKVRTGYMLVAGNASKHCTDLDTVQALLQRLEAA